MQMLTSKVSLLSGDLATFEPDIIVNMACMGLFLVCSVTWSYGYIQDHVQYIYSAIKWHKITKRYIT